MPTGQASTSCVGLVAVDADDDTAAADDDGAGRRALNILRCSRRNETTSDSRSFLNRR